MFNVTIVNKDELKNFFKYYGETAAVCYNTDPKYAIGVGKSCLQTEHFSGSRHRYIVIKFENISRACADQISRHSTGTALNMKSFRYVPLHNFNYHTPPLILKNSKAKEIYDKHMKATQIAYSEICEALESDGYKGEKVYECARGVAPMNAYTSMVMGFTPEALINFLNKRLCVCSQYEIQQVAKKVREIVLSEIPELSDKLVAICQRQLWCPESPKRSCGAYPQKDELKLALSEYRAKRKGNI